MQTSVKTFGQEFYPYEAIRALKFADKTKIDDRRALIDHLASQLPHSSEMTRLRVAAKFVQRYMAGNRTQIVPPPQQQALVRMVARNRHTPTQIELLFLRLTKADTIVGAMARELFYPVCVMHRPPAGYSENEFAAMNGAQLLAPEPLLTRSFIIEYSKEKWKFSNLSTLDRALRVLQAAGLVARERQAELRGHPRAFRMSRHNISLATFIYSLYDEFLPQAQSGGVIFDNSILPNSDFARTFLLSPEQIEEHARAARSQQFLASHGANFRLIFGNMDALVDALLAKAI
jgi:hypothetical protein